MAASGAPLPPAEQRAQPALKWIQIQSLPRTLTLHLKRFRSTGRRVHKIDEHVPFPMTLEISPFVCPPGEPKAHFTELDDLTSSSAPSEMLRLYALVEHEGSFSGGHYIAYVRLGEVWYKMSDSAVTHVDAAFILERQAFLLFYERVLIPIQSEC